MPAVFFAIFALVMLGGYLAARRRLTQPILIVILMASGGFLSMFLVSLSSGNAPPHALFVGLIVGLAFTTILLLMAYSFDRRERRAARTPPPAPRDDAP